MRWISTIGAAAGLMLVPALAVGSAQASSSASSTGPSVQAGQVLHVFADSGFSGVDAWLSTPSDNTCTYVGDGWNDRVRSARTEGPVLVELWEHVDCTGTSIVVDASGFGNIGPWVTAIRSRG